MNMFAKNAKNEATKISCHTTNISIKILPAVIVLDVYLLKLL